MEVIAVTKLNFWLVLKILIKNSNYRIYYYHSVLPQVIFRYIKKRIDIIPVNLNSHKEYYNELEKRLHEICCDITNQNVVIFYIEKLSRILGIGNKHVKNAVTKHFIRVLRDDVFFICLLNIKVLQAKRYLIENPHTLLFLFHKPAKVKKVNTVNIIELRNFIAFVLWPLFTAIFLINSKFNKKQFSNIRLIFQQKYSKRFGWNAEFDAFYRYFETRDDVGYHCKKKRDEIYNSVISNKKLAFTTLNLNVTACDGIKLINLLLRLVILTFKTRLLSKIRLLTMVLSIFRDYTTTTLIMTGIRPQYMIRIRTEMYPNHPIITGICEMYDCKHIGYFHGPPVFFEAEMAIIDFHYIGVMGNFALTHTYREILSGHNCYVLGPISADINFEAPVKKKDPHLLATFLATSAVDDESDILFKKSFSMFVNVVKDRNIRLIYRDKIDIPERINFIENLCRTHNIIFSIDIFNNGKTIGDYASNVLKKSDFIVVQGLSTAPWECLSLERKFLVVLGRWQTHPLENFIPNLIVRDEEKFKDKLTWLLDFSYDEYRKSIGPLVSELSKKANGKLVREFFEDFIAINNESNKNRITSHDDGYFS